VADQLAAEGFIAIAPDFLAGTGRPQLGRAPGDSARRLIGGVNSTERNRVIRRSQWAMTQPAATRSTGSSAAGRADGLHAPSTAA
jgi:carboxymethylenebutenolidase